MIFFIILIFLSGIIQSQCNEKENCVNEKLRQCSNQYKTVAQFYPSTPDELQQYCRTIEQKNECFRNSWMQCITEAKEREDIISRLNDTSSDHYRNLCDFSTTYSKLLLKYGKCLNLTVSEQNKCQNKYELLGSPKDKLLTALGYSKNNSRAENYQKVRQLCCWWTEYQSCVVRSVVDRCGEHAAILVNEEFFKKHTSNATAKVLTYKSCMPQDKTFRFPVCLLGRSVDPKSIGFTFDDMGMSIEDNSRRIDIEETIGMASNLTDFPKIEASIELNDKSFSMNSKISQILIIISILIKFNLI